jgi:hypothetical protein
MAAVADGETDLVPAATLTHLAGCQDCAQEVETHHLLGQRLQASLEANSNPVHQRSKRRWVVRVAAASAAVVIMAGGVAGWRAHTGEDTVAAAVAVAGQQPQYQSTDAASIGSWCERASGRPMHGLELPGLSPLGVRMDHRAGVEIVTISYATASGDHIAVGWLDSSQTDSAAAHVQTQRINGRTVLVVTAPAGKAVISGDAPLATLWEVAAYVEAGPSSAITAAASS